MKTKRNKTSKTKERPSLSFFYKSPKIEYVWFAYVDLEDGQGPAWHGTDFKEESVEKANKWRTNPIASDVFNKPTILVRKVTVWDELTSKQYAELSMSSEERQELEMAEWRKRKCIFGDETQKLCSPTRYFDCRKCRR